MEDATPKCGWCGASLEGKRSNAQYCSRQHKKNAGSRRHRERNPGYYSRYNYRHAERREANRDELNAKAREYQRRRRAADPQGTAQKAREWWQSNPDKHRLYQANRRYKQANNPGSVGVSERDWQRMVSRYRGCCAYCGTPATKLDLDHVVPLKAGGRHAIGNVLPACRSCNSSKNARLLADWRHRG